MLTFGKRVAITKISLYYSLKNFYGAPITETEHLQVPAHTYKGILTGLNRVCACGAFLHVYMYMYMYIKTTKRPWIWEGVGRDTGGAGGREGKVEMIEI